MTNAGWKNVQAETFEQKDQVEWSKQMHHADPSTALLAISDQWCAWECPPQDFLRPWKKKGWSYQVCCILENCFMPPHQMSIQGPAVMTLEKVEAS